MSKVAAFRETLEKALKDESKPWTKYFAYAEKKFSVDRLYIFLGMV